MFSRTSGSGLISQLERISMFVNFFLDVWLALKTARLFCERTYKLFLLILLKRSVLLGHVARNSYALQNRIGSRSILSDELYCLKTFRMQRMN